MSGKKSLSPLFPSSIFLFWKSIYWHTRSPLPEIIPLVKHFVRMGSVSSLFAYHSIGFLHFIVISRFAMRSFFCLQENLLVEWNLDLKNDWSTLIFFLEPCCTIARNTHMVKSKSNHSLSHMVRKSCSSNKN